MCCYYIQLFSNDVYRRNEAINLNYRLFILNSLKNKTEEEKIKWIDHMIEIIEKVNLWEESDKEIYFALSNEKENLLKRG